MPDIAGTVERWVERRRPALLAARYRPAPRSSALDVRLPLKDALNAFAPKVHPDTRTEEQYADQVEKFTAEAENALMERAIWDLYRHSPALLHLEVTNPTDLGYTAVRLILHIPGEVKSYPDELADVAEGDRPRFPAPPTPLGTPTVTDHPLIAQMARGYGTIMPPLFPGPGRSFDPGPGYTVRDSGSVDIEYREFELRPGQTMTLESVPLLVREDPGVALTATWYATAADVRGRLTGEFELTITESALDLANLDRDDETDGEPTSR
jgi:hypothetical protein